jgi:hypothetical protein
METEIKALLAGVASGRRYWVRAPQGTALPHVVLYRVDGIPGYHFQGRDNVVSSRVQATCTATTYAAARQTADVVIAALDGVTTRTDSPPGRIQAIFIESDGRDLATEDAGSVNQLFAVAVDFSVIHEP